MPPLIDFQKADLGYSRRSVILRGVDIDIDRGNILGVVGPNGSGKSTFIRSLLGLLPPVSGAVKIVEGTRFGYVPQRETVDVLFPIPVEDIVLMGRYGRLGVLRRPGAADRQLARECLESVSVQHLAQRDFGELSGGQRQRVMIARALASEPDALVMDEPSSGMDMRSERELLELIVELHRKRGLCVVLVSHLLESIAEVSQRIAIIAHGSIEEGAHDEILSAERLSRLYDLPVQVHHVDGRIAIVPGTPLS